MDDILVKVCEGGRVVIPAEKRFVFDSTAFLAFAHRETRFQQVAEYLKCARGIMSAVNAVEVHPPSVYRRTACECIGSTAVDPKQPSSLVCHWETVLAWLSR
jgi:PIN domain nuclease of toxin-antitoxin system